MVKPTHLSIQQNSWRWKFVKIRFSCCERMENDWNGIKKKKKKQPSYFTSRTLTVMGWHMDPYPHSHLFPEQNYPPVWSSPSSLLKHSNVSLCWPPILQDQAQLHAHVEKLSRITLWMKFSTLVCRPHHLNLTVTSLYAHMWGQSVFSSFCQRVKKTFKKKLRNHRYDRTKPANMSNNERLPSVSVPGTFHSGLKGPLPVFVEWKRAGSSSGL